MTQHTLTATLTGDSTDVATVAASITRTIGDWYQHVIVPGSFTVTKDPDRQDTATWTWETVDSGAMTPGLGGEEP